ncbi:endothelial lipase-like, partial [Rhagoletis pomonella]|uniref:endothelial lipase-like n=1 Tax=Rhagoletis pomonella TaxID=28610 RepID=UPI0017837C76
MSSAANIGTGFPFDCIFASEECPNEHIKFWLYKNATQGEPLLLDALNFSAIALEPRWPLKILIHGFNGNQHASPNQESRPILLHTQQAYVISMDYCRLTRFPCYYPSATANARVVARCLTQLIDQLIASGIYLASDLHLIGFSLGAQIAGLSVNFVKQRLQRITGIRNCNHFRAPLYYAESIGSERGFWSYNCGEWLECVMQQCRRYADVPHTPMGYFVSK